MAGGFSKFCRGNSVAMCSVSWQRVHQVPDVVVWPMRVVARSEGLTSPHLNKEGFVQLVAEKHDYSRSIPCLHAFGQDPGQSWHRPRVPLCARLGR